MLSYKLYDIIYIKTKFHFFSHEIPPGASSDSLPWPANMTPVGGLDGQSRTNHCPKETRFIEPIQCVTMRKWYL